MLDKALEKENAMPKAMNLTYGDFIIIEIALVLYLKELDLSMQSGQYFSELLGKIEYELLEIKKAAGVQLEHGLQFTPDLTDAPH